MTRTRRNEIGNQRRASSKSQSRNVMTCTARGVSIPARAVERGGERGTHAQALCGDDAAAAHDRLDREQEEVHVEALAGYDELCARKVTRVSTTSADPGEREGERGLAVDDLRAGDKETSAQARSSAREKADAPS